MSLINDALRRASETAPPVALPPATLPPALIPPPPGPALATPQFNELRPAEAKAPIHRSPLFLGILAVLLICAIGFFFWNRRNQAAMAKKDTLRPILVTSSSALKTVANSPLVAAAANGTGSVPLTARSSNTPSSTARPGTNNNNGANPTTIVAAAAPAPAPVFPSLRLQSVYYRSNNPLVMINGRMLAVNDQVQGVTVAAINPSSVTLVLSGRTNVLTLR